MLHVVQVCILITRWRIGLISKQCYLDRAHWTNLRAWDYQSTSKNAFKIQFRLKPWYRSVKKPPALTWKNYGDIFGKSNFKLSHVIRYKFLGKSKQTKKWNIQIEILVRSFVSICFRVETYLFHMANAL